MSEHIDALGGQQDRALQPKFHAALLETWSQFGNIVERYKFVSRDIDDEVGGLHCWLRANEKTPPL